VIEKDQTRRSPGGSTGRGTGPGAACLVVVGVGLTEDIARRIDGYAPRDIAASVWTKTLRPFVIPALRASKPAGLAQMERNARVLTLIAAWCVKQGIPLDVEQVRPDRPRPPRGSTRSRHGGVLASTDGERPGGAISSGRPCTAARPSGPASARAWVPTGPSWSVRDRACGASRGRTRETGSSSSRWSRSARRCRGPGALSPGRPPSHSYLCWPCARSSTTRWCSAVFSSTRTSPK
jgi:hypothetical protein